MTVKKVYRERQEVSISTPLKMIRFFIFIFNCLLHQLCDNVYFVLLFTFRKSITHTTQDRMICTIMQIGHHSSRFKQAIVGSHVTGGQYLQYGN